MALQIVKKADHCAPSEPPPGTQEEPCEGTITGTIRMDCCCAKMVTRTFILDVGPQTDAQLVNFVQNTVNAYEQSGYLVVAHSIVDTGGGWMLGLSIAWYA